MAVAAGKPGTPYSTGSGNLVNNTNQNGYILYFSDRRGMLPDLYAVARVSITRLVGHVRVERRQLTPARLSACPMARQ